jgi:alpha-beta hydrolase superfamily lysophospholipase
MHDRLNTTENMTAKMGVLSVEAMQLLGNNAEVVDPNSTFCRMPVLLLQGTADSVTSANVARMFYARIANFDKNMIEYEGLFHCLFNEPEQEQVLSDATQWLVGHARHFHSCAKAQDESPSLIARL